MMMMFAAPQDLRVGGVLQPVSANRQNQGRHDPSEQIGRSEHLQDYFDLPRKVPQTRAEFDVFDDNKIAAAEFLVGKEVFTGNRIKLCVGVDESVTQSLRDAKEDAVRNRDLLEHRIDYTLRHADEERKARNVYEKIRKKVFGILGEEPYQCLWPFVMVYSCYEFTSIRRDFQHGHCLYLMVTISSPDDEDAVRSLRGNIKRQVKLAGGENVLDVAIQRMADYSLLSHDGTRLLDSRRSRNLPRNTDYQSRPTLGCSLGPAVNGMSGSLGGYVASQSGSIYAVTASHAVGAGKEAVVSPSTVDLGSCFQHARAMEEISLQKLDHDIRTTGGGSRQTSDSRRRWEHAQEELLTFVNVNGAPGKSSHFGTVTGKHESSLLVDYNGTTSESYVDLAVISCDRNRVGYNIIPTTNDKGRATSIEVFGARSPICGEAVIKSGRSSGLTAGRVLSVLASVGWYERQQVLTAFGQQILVKPRVSFNWCITSEYGHGESGVFAEPGDSGAWVLAQPPQSETSDGQVGTQHTPVVGSIMCGFVSADGIDLVMFQPWEYMSYALQLITGERCVPLQPLSYELAEFRGNQGFHVGCGICLDPNAQHFVEDCPERYLPEARRTRTNTLRLSRIQLFEPRQRLPVAMDIEA